MIQTHPHKLAYCSLPGTLVLPRYTLPNMITTRQVLLRSTLFFLCSLYSHGAALPLAADAQNDGFETKDVERSMTIAQPRSVDGPTATWTEIVIPHPVSESPTTSPTVIWTEIITVKKTPGSTQTAANDTVSGIATRPSTVTIASTERLTTTESIITVASTSTPSTSTRTGIALRPWWSYAVTGDFIKARDVATAADALTMPNRVVSRKDVASDENHVSGWGTKQTRTVTEYATLAIPPSATTTLAVSRFAERDDEDRTSYQIPHSALLALGLTPTQALTSTATDMTTPTWLAAAVATIETSPGADETGEACLRVPSSALAALGVTVTTPSTDSEPAVSHDGPVSVDQANAG